MTKQISKLAVDTIVPAVAPAAPAAVVQKPYCLTLTGAVALVLQESAVLIRQGYTPDINTPVQIFGATGTISMVLVIGNPEQVFVERAAVTTADAVALEQARYLADVERAAARQIEEAAKAQLAAKRIAMIVEQRKQLAALEAEIASA